MHVIVMHGRCVRIQQKPPRLEKNGEVHRGSFLPVRVKRGLRCLKQISEEIACRNLLPKAASEPRAGATGPGLPSPIIWKYRELSLDPIAHLKILGL